MQLGGKPPKKSSSLFDADFASGFEDGKFDKFKPIIKVFIILLLIAGMVMGGVWVYSKSTDQNSETTDLNHLSEPAREDDSEPDSVTEESQEVSEQDVSPVKDGTATSGASEQKNTNTQGGSSTVSSQSNYDPNKCKSLVNEYKRLEAVSDNNYTAFNNAVNSAKIWGDIYEEMGRNKALTEQAYNKQKSHIEELQVTWKDSLDDQNNAYSAFQKCQASNY